MQPEPPDLSTTSNSRLRKIGSRLRRIGSKQEKGAISPLSDTAPVQKFVLELDATETATFPASDPVSDVSEDPSFQQLRDNIRHLYGASLGVNGVDSTYAAYSRYRGQSLELCKALVQKSKNLGSISPFDTRPLDDPEAGGYDAWLTALHDFKKYQEGLLETLRESLSSTYHRYEPDATNHQIDMLFVDRAFRDIAISKMETTSNPLIRQETPDYWPKYVERLGNFDQLKLDLLRTEALCAMARSGKGPNVAIREYDIATNGDTILEFSNSVSETHPVLRFRVSSHMLTEASPFFARIFSTPADSNSPRELLDGYPSPPQKQVCRDGTEVKVYRMPQLELNKWEALTTVLHAAHMHNDQVPREVRFYEFVSIAEVCLRYQCTSPVEMAVEYRWLPQWLHRANDDSPDGFLLITYVFGLRRLFKRMTKTAILNIASDEELEGKELWPHEVKDRIGAVRQAKLAQIYASCASLMKEYVKEAPPVHSVDRGSRHSLTTTPKCPRGLHQCDAANLGWLMLVYNELGILPAIISTANNHHPSVHSSGSISALVTSLGRMPSPPQLHSGICDYAPAFRGAINDIYNSITGLTLRDVTGIDGWALSKRHDLRTKFSDDALREVFELPAPVEQPIQDPNGAAIDAVNLRILSHLDDLRDLHAAAMVNKAFYSVYKKHELDLMRNLIKAGKRKVTATATAVMSTNTMQRSPQKEYSVPPDIGHSFILRPSATHTKARPQRPTSIQMSGEDLYDTTPPTSPFKSHHEIPLSSSEIEDILWPNEGTADETAVKSIRDRLNGNIHNLDPESNAKFLSGDVVHVDKSLVLEGRKHLREEQDRSLRMLPQNNVSSPC